MGISRSATVVCAYLVATARMTPHEALVAVRAKRGIVSPNMGFLRQLDEYANQFVGGQSSARRADRAGQPCEVLLTFPFLLCFHGRHRAISDWQSRDILVECMLFWPSFVVYDHTTVHTQTYKWLNVKRR